MKKNIIYIGILVFGVVLGSFLFGKGLSKQEVAHNHSKQEKTKQMWTCSMHPQIMQPEPGNCPICGMDLIPANTAGESLSSSQFKLTKNAMAIANIQTSVVGTSTSKDNSVKLSGKITENQDANLVQASYFSGRIERLNVSSVGEEVKKGQLLATIYSPELFSAQQELITAASLKQSQPDLYKAVRNKLKLWKISDSQINQIEASGQVKQNFPIYATVSGTVSEKLVEQGDYVKQGQALLKIMNLNTVWANFDVYENQIKLFKKGQDIIVTTKAYPNEKYKTKVDFINPVLNAQTRTVALRVVLNNKNKIFKPGMFVEGQIEEGGHNAKEEITVPSSAVLWTGKRSLVYVKTQPNQPVFEMREVVLGNRIGDTFQVLEGLKNGDEIVTNGTFTVDAAAQLQGKKSMMNKENGKQDNNKAMVMELSKDFQEQFVHAIPSYLQLKDAFVESDVAEVAENAQKTLGKLKNINQKNITKMLKAHLSKSIEMLASISQANKLETQRSNFVILNENIIAIAQNLKNVTQPLYVQKCPMANNEKGAVWLSAEKEIKNPYFGSAMLTCGEVKQTIK
ncbi:efflux RND transporter periplasmic adaptor subunit [Tenacibaculum sp. UWU-22]|uniref:efflux RND transporter periplasmic adaptor subunit n=1 Tax=Tenacibaculum sp. UWU-22 TaxID=3234187 RepID=UPI0034DABE74